MRPFLFSCCANSFLGNSAYYLQIKFVQYQCINQLIVKGIKMTSSQRFTTFVGRFLLSLIFVLSV